jgi:hypothetical protein
VDTQSEAHPPGAAPEAPEAPDWSGVVAMRGGRGAARVAVARLLAQGAADCLLIVHPGASGGLDPAPAPAVPVQWLAAAVLLARRGEWGAVRALTALLPAPPAETAGQVGESLAALASLAAL